MLLTQFKPWGLDAEMLNVLSGGGAWWGDSPCLECGASEMTLQNAH